MIHTTMSKCIICFVEHDRMWTVDKPAMYCDDCALIKHDSIDVVSQITDTLFLSGIVAAGKFNGHRLCVHENTPTYGGQFHHIPILAKKPTSSIDRTGALVDMNELNRAADLIQNYVDTEQRLLVHCVGGVERSPLTLAYYFLRSKQAASWEEAYKFLKSKRPVVSERLFWLPT